MNFNRKLILLTVVPVVLGMTAIVFWLSKQTRELSELQAIEFKQAIVEHRKAHLKDYVQIVQSAVDYLDNSADNPEFSSAKSIVGLLTHIEFSEDGYFYVYDELGNGVVHPRQPFRVGANWLDLTDTAGTPVIKGLLEKAQAGGGFTEYLWEKPSLGSIARKIGYSEMIDNRNWMIGTGAYFDDIDSEVSNVQAVMAPHISTTMSTGALIAALAVAAVFSGGLILQLNEKRLADSKLRELTGRIVQAQDEERRRFSRELHDSISQSLVGVRYLLEDVQAEQQFTDTGFQQSLNKPIEHLDNTLNEVRRISRDLHPSLLDDIGLVAAVEALLDGFRQRTGIHVEYQTVKVRNLLPAEARTALYRVVQEALTNIEKHSQAGSITVQFGIRQRWFGVTIRDNGIGFDASEALRQPSAVGGIGLRNITERLSYLDGICEIYSDNAGTEIFAGVPKSLLRRSHLQAESIWSKKFES